MLNHCFFDLMVTKQRTSNNIANRILISGSFSVNGTNVLVSLRISRLRGEKGRAVVQLTLSSGCVSRKAAGLRGTEQQLMNHSTLPVRTLMADIITRDLTALSFPCINHMKYNSPEL